MIKSVFVELEISGPLSRYHVVFESSRKWVMDNVKAKNSELYFLTVWHILINISSNRQSYFKAYHNFKKLVDYVNFEKRKNCNHLKSITFFNIVIWQTVIDTNDQKLGRIWWLKCVQGKRNAKQIKTVLMRWDKLKAQLANVRLKMTFFWPL